MSIYLGYDTSNYTTSAALFDSCELTAKSERKLLPVKDGELGVRQSDAVFHHTVQIPEVTQRLFESAGRDCRVSAVGASVRPRDVDGSYMPCFLVGKCVAECTALSDGVPLFRFSHQAGHIAAALFSADRLDMLGERFVAFHVSGGTTEAVIAEYDEEKIIKCIPLISSLDLKAGQAIDRTGVMLGLPFPSGRYVDELAKKSTKKFKYSLKLRDGCCSLSGLQNKCEKMKREGESDEDICCYCIGYIAEALGKMTEYAIEKCGDIPVVYSGGVTSNTTLREEFTARFGAIFGSRELSSDNAVGIAVLTALKSGENLGGVRL